MSHLIQLPHFPFLSDDEADFSLSIDSQPIKLEDEVQRVYTNYLKNREFGKEAPQNHYLERMTIAGRQGMSENNDFGEKPTPPKTDSSSSLCIHSAVNPLISEVGPRDLPPAKRSHPTESQRSLRVEVVEESLGGGESLPVSESQEGSVRKRSIKQSEKAEPPLSFYEKLYEAAMPSQLQKGFEWSSCGKHLIINHKLALEQLSRHSSNLAALKKQFNNYGFSVWLRNAGESAASHRSLTRENWESSFWDQIENKGYLNVSGRLRKRFCKRDENFDQLRKQMTELGKMIQLQQEQLNNIHREFSSILGKVSQILPLPSQPKRLKKT
jgi:hypothetical protein